jgi:hypothetical protein
VEVKKRAVTSPFIKPLLKQMVFKSGCFSRGGVKVRFFIQRLLLIGIAFSIFSLD